MKMALCSQREYQKRSKRIIKDHQKKIKRLAINTDEGEEGSQQPVFGRLLP
jgi:hypothetical protein